MNGRLTCDDTVRTTCCGWTAIASSRSFTSAVPSSVVAIPDSGEVSAAQPASPDDVAMTTHVTQVRVDLVSLPMITEVSVGSPTGSNDAHRVRLSKGVITVKKTTLLIGGAIGYVLGTRAGRERYDQIKQTAGKVRRNPTVQSVVDDARAEAKAAARQAADSVTETVRKAASSDDAADGFDTNVPPMGSTS